MIRGRFSNHIESNIGSNIGSNPVSKAKRRLSRDELRKVILGVCEEWVSLEYIATTIDRNPDYLLTNVIPSMLEEGIIGGDKGPVIGWLYVPVPRHQSLFEE